MKKLALLIVLPILFASLAQASVGPVEVYAVCSGPLNEGTPASFVLRATEAPNLLQGVLKIGANPANSYCKKQAVDDKKLFMTCTEFRQGDGKLFVVLRSGNQGFVSAQVLLESVYPRAPKVLGTLSCR